MTIIKERLTVAILLAVFVLSACGRREHRAFFDAVPPQGPRLPAAKPLPESALHVRWSPPNVPTQLIAGQLLPVKVTFTNIGDTTWPDKTVADPKEASGRNAVRLSYSFEPVGQTSVRWQRSGPRSDLIKPVAPGESATLEIVVRATDQPGDYKLSFELLQEGVVWFADRGADTLTVPVRVSPPYAAAVPKSTQTVPRP
jgi:hypothetical protein